MIEHRTTLNALGVRRPGTILDIQPNEPWRDQANCKDAPPGTFHPTPGRSWKNVKQDAEPYCTPCPVTDQCREFGRGEAYGYFGGVIRDLDNGARRRYRQRQKAKTS